MSDGLFSDLKRAGRFRVQLLNLNRFDPIVIKSTPELRTVLCCDLVLFYCRFILQRFEFGRLRVSAVR